MSDESVLPSVGELERRIAEMRAELERLPILIEQAEADLAAAEGPLAESRQVWDTVARARGEVAGFGTHDAGETWQPRSSESLARQAEAAREADEVFTAADRDLARRLVARNEADRRRSDLHMRQRALEGAIAMAERELGLVRRQQAAVGPDRLEAIRRRLFGPSTPAA